jgi:hypothetical protein
MFTSLFRIPHFIHRTQNELTIGPVNKFPARTFENPEKSHRRNRTRRQKQKNRSKERLKNCNRCQA